MAVNRYVPRRVNSNIYQLKRAYGGTISLYRKGDPTTDIKTGEKIWPGRQVTVIQRAVILPVKFQRIQTQTISMISADKQFVYGGMYDRGARRFYIDPRDLPQGYDIEQDDYVIYNGKQYEIKNIIENEFETLWLLEGVELVGVIPEQIHILSGYDILDIQESGVN